jgi:TolB-like protein/Tfp pilus assembly protein PilF
MSGFIAELKRRNVIRMAGLYLVGAWLITQVSATVLPLFHAPDWLTQGVVIALAVGFIPAMIFAWIFELTPDGLKRDAEVEPDESIAPQTAQKMNRLILALLVLAVVYFGVDKFVLAPKREAALITQTTQAVTEKVASQEQSENEKSIAVLAFENRSADKDNEYFSDGVAEEILNSLAKVKDLKVAGRTSSFFFKGKNESLGTIGKTLGVAHVLEGSVRKQGDKLRITAQLIRISDGFQMWSETFDGNDEDIFALQEKIAQQVTSELQVALNAGQQGRLVEVGTADPDAYAMYLRATDVFNRRDVKSYPNAIQGLHEALKLDPKFARAHSRLATLYYVMAGNSTAERYRDATEMALIQARQALQLNPMLAEPYAVIGSAKGQTRAYPEARRAFARALELDPKDATANLWSSLAYCYTGYIAKCEQGLDRTLEIEPLLPNALNWRARLWVSAGDLDKAQRMIDRARQVGLGWPAAVTLASIASKRGDLANKRKYYLETYQALSADFDPQAAEIFASASIGDAAAIARTRLIMDAYLANPPEYISPLVPVVLIRIGDVERGLNVGAEHITTNEAAFLGENLGTRINPKVFASPAFAEFLRKSGIAAFWDEFGAPEHCQKNQKGDYVCE